MINSKPQSLQDLSLSEIEIQRIKSLAQKQYNTYPREIKLLALAMRAEGQTLRDISEKIGASASTISAWSKDPKLYYGDIQTKKLSDSIKRGLAHKYYSAANTFLDHALDEDKLLRARSSELMIASGTAFDKGRLCEGKSTENISHITKHIQSSEARIKELDQNIIDIEAQLKDTCS